MQLNIPQNDNYEVISVPRSNISLKGILKLLIDILPDDLRKEYDDRLSKSSAVTMSPHNLKEELRRSIAGSIGLLEPQSTNAKERVLEDILFS